MNLDESIWQPNAAGEYLAALDEYKDAVLRLIPSLSRSVLDDRSVHPVDVLALGYFLEYYAREAVVLDSGVFIGTSAFFFASHPKVSHVICVDQKLSLSDGLAANSEARSETPDFELPEDVRAFDLVRAALAEFGEERGKIELREVVMGNARAGAGDVSAGDAAKVEVPVVDSTAGATLVAFVAGHNSREGVRADLEKIFDRNPHAVAFVDGCRHARGPFVQAGVVDFVERTSGEYHFQLIGDLGPGLAASNLGIVYPNPTAAEMRKTLADVAQTFSRRLDPLRLLNREEELAAIVSRTNQELAQARQQLQQNSQLKEQNSRLKGDNDRLNESVSRLEQKNSQLIAHNSSRRYKLADALAGRALRVPLARDLLQRGRRADSRKP